MRHIDKSRGAIMRQAIEEMRKDKFEWKSIKMKWLENEWLVTVDGKKVRLVKIIVLRKFLFPFVSFFRLSDLEIKELSLE